MIEHITHRITALLAGSLLLLVNLSHADAGPEMGSAGHGDQRPNILLIVADDLGYADVGAFGGEIPTPNIDELAKNGMMLTRFHANMTCSPTRSMLFSGMDSHLAGLGVMAPPTDPRQLGQPGYEAYLNFRVASLADLLHDAGYHTYMTGKWHLGPTLETGPAARGFEQSFISLDGASHLGGLSWNGPGKAPYRDGTELVTVGDDFYSTRFYTERMIRYIDGNHGDGKPFFAYLAYTAPHWPLQAPPESIAKFKSWYDDGYEALYQRRLQRMKTLGLAPRDFSGEPPVAGQPAWDALSPEAQRVEARKMEIYAAMISDLDTYIGKFLEHLRAIGELDNTFIFFMSDNGPEPMRRDLTSPIKEWVARCCDNSYENLGMGNSYVMYGPNWARAGAVPFRRAKGTAFEGGTHVPAIVNFKDLVPAGVRNDGFSTVMDVMPTLLALAGTHHPGATYRGRPVLPMQGKSLLPLIAGQVREIHDQNTITGWELFGHRALRQGDWKIVWDAAQGDQASWQLFNLAQDQGELHDLSAREPQRLQTLRALWDQYRHDNGVILLP
jgi:arylsulfatase